MAKKEFYIYRTQAGEASVRPATDNIVQANDTISWSNVTGDDVFVSFADVFEPMSGNPKPHRMRIDHGTKHEPKVKAGTTGSYVYQVFCAATKSLAKGNSDPEIIIVP